MIKHVFMLFYTFSRNFTYFRVILRVFALFYTFSSYFIKTVKIFINFSKS